MLPEIPANPDDVSFVDAQTGELRIVRSDTPEAIRERVHAIVRHVNRAFISLGREIYMIFHRKLYLDWGYSTFDECVVDEFGISKEHADKLRRIWTKCVKELGLRPEQFDNIPYRSVYAMLPIINNENASVLIDRAKASETVKDFKEHLDLLRGKDHALDKARSSPGSMVEETITTIGRPTNEVNASVSEISDQVTPVDTSMDQKATRLTFNLYPSQLEIVNAAIQEVMRNKTTGVAPNEALAHVALEFMHARMTKEGEPNALVRFYLRQMENIYGGKFVWFTNNEAVRLVSALIDEHPDLFEEQGTGKTRSSKESDDEHDGDPGRGGHGHGNGGEAEADQGPDPQ